MSGPDDRLDISDMDAASESEYMAGMRAEIVRLKAELAVRERAMELLGERVIHVYECFDKCPKHMNETCDCTATAISQARLELDGKARITSLLSGRQQSEPSPDADLIAPNSIEDAPPDQIIRVDEIEEAYHSADNSKLVFKEAKS